jgi:hypothetical protein
MHGHWYDWLGENEISEESDVYFAKILRNPHRGTNIIYSSFQKSWIFGKIS